MYVAPYSTRSYVGFTYDMKKNERNFLSEKLFLVTLLLKHIVTPNVIVLQRIVSSNPAQAATWKLITFLSCFPIDKSLNKDVTETWLLC